MSTFSQNRKIISFDLDGTLVDTTYTNWVWEVGVAELYAQQYNVSLEDATEIIITEYKRAGDESLIWYDIGYWFDYFKLPASWQDLLDRHRDKIVLFPEVLEVLEALAQHYDLMITSNAAREFMEREIADTGIGAYFFKAVSVTSDYGLLKKSASFFDNLCTDLKTTPAQIIHVGDHLEHDYVAPQQCGLKSYFLNRNGSAEDGFHQVSDLGEFAKLML